MSDGPPCFKALMIVSGSLLVIPWSRALFSDKQGCRRVCLKGVQTRGRELADFPASELFSSNVYSIFARCSLFPSLMSYC